MSVFISICLVCNTRCNVVVSQVIVPSGDSAWATRTIHSLLTASAELSALCRAYFHRTRHSCLCHTSPWLYNYFNAVVQTNLRPTWRYVLAIEKKAVCKFLFCWRNYNFLWVLKKFSAFYWNQNSLFSPKRIQTIPFNTAALSPILILLSHLLLNCPILAPSFWLSGRNFVITVYFLCVQNCIKVPFSLIYEATASVPYHFFLSLSKRNFLIYRAQLN